jgi:hypothetical protein
MDTVALIFLIILGLFVVGGIVALILYLKAISKGKIEIKLTKYEFKPGETIEGTLDLKMKTPVEANSLNVGIIGTLRTTNYSKNSNGGVSRSSSNRIVFDFKKPLDGKKTYMGEQSYDFKLTVPSDIYKRSTGNQMADGVLKSVEILTGSNSRVEYYLTANLDMKGFDISKKIRINIV